MKKQLLIIVFTFFISSVFAQRDADYNYSIGFMGYNLMQMPKVMNETNSDKIVASYFNGGIFKFNDNQISYRISGGYLKKKKNFKNDCKNCDEISGDVTDYTFKVGFDKSMNFSVLQPYFGVDLGYRFNKFDGEGRNINPMVRQASVIVPNSSIKTTKSGFVIAPLLGIKINALSFASLFAEANLDFFYSYERQESVTQDMNATRTLKKTNQAEYLINPVSVGVLFHFGSNK